MYEAQCNQIVASATKTLTVEAVGSRHAKLLNIEPGTPAVVIERLAYGYDRQPLEWRRSRGPARLTRTLGEALQTRDTFHDQSRY